MRNSKKDCLYRGFSNLTYKIAEDWFCRMYVTNGKLGTAFAEAVDSILPEINPMLTPRGYEDEIKISGSGMQGCIQMTYKYIQVPGLSVCDVLKLKPENNDLVSEMEFAKEELLFLQRAHHKFRSVSRSNFYPTGIFRDLPWLIKHCLIEIPFSRKEALVAPVIFTKPESDRLKSVLDYFSFALKKSYYIDEQGNVRSKEIS